MKTRLFVGILLFGALCIWFFPPIIMPESVNIATSSMTSLQHVPEKNGLKNASTEDEPSESEPSDIPDSVFNTPRNRKVVAYLERFQERTSGITKGMIEIEQERVKQGLLAALGRKSSQPEITTERDQRGQKWDILSFDNGIIRYLPRD